MTKRTTYSPWKHVASMPDVLVDFDDDLPSGHAWWSPTHRVILMAKGLTSVQRRCALAHELAHVETGDCQVDGPDGERLERRHELAAERTAALRLVPLDDLMDSLAWCLSLDEVAHELHIDRAILDTRLAMLDSEDQAVIRTRFASEWSAC